LSATDTKLLPPSTEILSPILISVELPTFGNITQPPSLKLSVSFDKLKVCNSFVELLSLSATDTKLLPPSTEMLSPTLISVELPTPKAGNITQPPSLKLSVSFDKLK